VPCDALRVNLEERARVLERAHAALTQGPAAARVGTHERPEAGETPPTE
jgi:hypothetical protein